ncbi:MAG: nitroreductase family protein [Microbacterium sp.]
MFAVTDRHATTDVPVLDVFAERWSTRVFDAAAPLDEEAFASALEAARWAPSASNTQPWRLIVGRRGTDTHQKIFDALMGFNQTWAGGAGALVVFLADTRREDGEPLPWAIYDTGQAAAFFTIQAHAVGLFTHQMGGFEHEQLAEAFGLPAHVQPLAVMAVGTLGDPEQAPEKIRERELTPRTRRPLTDTIVVGD